MQYRVEMAERAERDLEEIYSYINADDSDAAADWFNGLEAEILSLAASPKRGTKTRENSTFRQVLYGSKPNVYRIIYAFAELAGVVTVAHIRHGARRPFRSLA